MFGKMMNRFYYGKSGQGDFSKEDLPQTRWQLFWEMLRIRLASLVRLNLTYMIVWIPAMIVITMGVLSAYSQLIAFMESAAQLDAGAITVEAAAQQNAVTMDMLKSLVLQTLLLLVPCITITGPATAGLAYVTRNWARDEHAFVWADFRDAAKENWKPALLTGFITGLMPVILYVCFTFYGQLAKQSVVFLVPQVLCLMLTLGWMCALLYIYPQMVTYDMKYRDILRNSFIMVVGRLPMTVGLKLLSLVPAAIAVAVSLFTTYFPYAVMVLGMYYILIGFALSRFIGASYSNAVFDRYININIEGAQVGRGLYVDEDDEDDDYVDPQM